MDVSLPAKVKANIALATNYGKLYAADGLKIAIDKSKTEEKPDESAAIAKTNSAPAGQILISGLKSGSIAIGTGVDKSKLATLSIYGGRSADEIKGKINGGGIDFILKSNYENVYLRVK